MKNLFFLILMALIMFSGCEKNITQPNGEENEMKKLEDGLKISGMIDVTIRRANGDIERKHYKSNTITGNLKEIVNDALLAPQDFALNSLFNGNVTPPTPNEDGIIIRTAAHYYEMDCSSAETATTITITGTFTGVADTFIEASLGFNHTAGDTDNFGTKYAIPTAWDNVILQVVDTLTIEWTITVGA